MRSAPNHATGRQANLGFAETSVGGAAGRLAMRGLKSLPVKHKATEAANARWGRIKLVA